MSFCACFCVLFLDSKEIYFFSVSYFHTLQFNYIENNTRESGDVKFFYQSSTRYLSSERSDFPHLANLVER